MGEKNIISNYQIESVDDDAILKVDDWWTICILNRAESDNIQKQFTILLVDPFKTNSIL